MRFFSDQSNRKVSIYEPNKFVSHDLDGLNSNSNQFQDDKIKLSCFGDCGSTINKFLLDNTNLTVYRSCHQTPRVIDVYFGRAPKYFYENLSFGEHEENFLTMFADHMAKKGEEISMGSAFFPLNCKIILQFSNDWLFNLLHIDSIEKQIIRWKRRSENSPSMIVSFPIFGKDDSDKFQRSCMMVHVQMDNI